MQFNKITLVVIALIAINADRVASGVSAIEHAPASSDVGLNAADDGYLSVQKFHGKPDIIGDDVQHMAITTKKAATTASDNDDDAASGAMKKNKKTTTTTTTMTMELMKKNAPKKLPAFLFNGDLRKIHSNSKSIASNSGRHFFFEHNFESIGESDSDSESEPESQPEQSLKKMPAKKKKQQHKNTDVKEDDDVVVADADAVAGDSKGLAKKKKKKTQQQRELSLRRRLFKQLKGKKVRGPKKHLKRQKEQLMSMAKPSINFDMLESHRTRRAVIAKKNRLWEHAIIPYEIEEDLFRGSHKALFKQAMRHYENHTCIKFVERDPKLHENYIFFTIQSCGCCSPVGRQSGRQNISIGHGCEKFGIVVHELGHAIGFLHEHTRTDRDQYITIKKTNILKGQEYNFDEKEDVDSLGLPYDYNSIMHYAKNTFSKSVYLDTIQPIGDADMNRADMGQRVRLSSGDIAKANLLYKCPKCGRTFQQSSGQITAPHYLYAAGSSGGEEGGGSGDGESDGFEKSLEQCEWRITASRGERIVLQVHQLNLLESENCEVDYLEVRDGYWHESPIKRRICGNMTAETIKSDSSRMLINYVNHNAIKGYRGFIADYEVTCGGNIYLDEGNRIIDSPTQSSAGEEPTYAPDKECVWILHVSGHHQVGLNFLSFELENHDNCIYDYVEIRDGNSADSELIGVFCGDRLPPNIKTNTNQMYVKFVSDGSVQKVGFSALFLQELDECKFGNHSCAHKCINTLGSYQCACYAGYELEANGRSCKDACGGIIDASTPNGTLYSPSYPEVYPSRKQCVWEVVAPSNHAVFLNFTHFDLEGTKFQCFDYLVVYSKLEDSSLKKIGMFCGNQLPPTINSLQNVLRLEFYSDKSVQRSGFAARFHVDADECTHNNGGCQHHCRNTFGAYKCSCRKGYTLQEDSHSCLETKCKFEITKSYGVIYSPNYPEDYPRNSYCFWHFQTVLGHRVQLTFHDFDVESHQECIYDYVAIYDGRSENASSLGVYCGGQEPYAVIASTNEMFMLLKTDYGLQRKGFMATYATECGSYLRATNQTQHFYSHPRYGSRPYKRNMYCNWRVQSDAESSVRIEFLHFEIEDSERCDYDYVEVTEELTLARNVNNNHGRFCGNKQPPPIVSYSDTLLIRFQTDESTSLRGFVISFVAVDPPDDEMIEMDAVTPFPGYMKSMFYSSDSDYDDNRAALPLLHYDGGK